MPFTFKKVPVKVGKIFEPSCLGNRDDLVIGCIKHSTGFSDTDAVQELDKTVTRHVWKLRLKVISVIPAIFGGIDYRKQS